MMARWEPRSSMTVVTSWTKHDVVIVSGGTRDDNASEPRLTPAALRRVEAARARVRHHIWSLLPDGLPASKVAEGDLGEVVVRSTSMPRSCGP